MPFKNVFVTHTGCQLTIVDQSIPPEVLAVFELFFTSYFTALLSTDDEDFHKHMPIATSDAAAMASVLRSVVVRSMSVATFSSAWQSRTSSSFVRKVSPSMLTALP